MLMMGQLDRSEILHQAPDSGMYIDIGRGLFNSAIDSENALIIFGPGYGLFLGIMFLLFGFSPYFIILIQIILSSFGCLVLYELGKVLTESKWTGLLAGYLLALSFTSISLSVIILSDCLYFFLFLSANLMFLKGLKTGRVSYFVSSGILLGVAILVRSIGQFWPLVLLLLVFIFPGVASDRKGFSGRLKLLKKAYLAPLLAVLIISLWIGRNYIRNGEPILAFTSAGGPANVASITAARLEGGNFSAIKNSWIEEYKELAEDTVISRADRYRIEKNKSRQLFKEYPDQMMITYFNLVWENMNSFNELYRVQMPKYIIFLMDSFYWLRDRGYYYLGFALSMIGFTLILALRRWPMLIFLGLVYSYSAMMIGFTRWQGSRLFHPGQIAQSILIAFIIIVVFTSLSKLVIYIKKNLF